MGLIPSIYFCPRLVEKMNFKKENVEKNIRTKNERSVEKKANKAIVRFFYLIYLT